MNPLYSVRFRLFALCISLLVVLGGANLLLGSINQQHEAQIQQLQEQYRRVNVIYSVQQAMVTYRYWQGQVNDAILLHNNTEPAEAELDKAKVGLEAEFAELAQFDSSAADILRETIPKLRVRFREGVTAMANHDPHAEEIINEAVQLINTIESTLNASTKRERTAADSIELLARAKALRGERLSAIIILVSSVVGIALTFLVLNSIIRPMQTTVRALRMVNAGEESIDFPPVSRDEFGDMAVALRQFRDQAERLRRLAYVDPLTGVGNRARLEESFKEAISVGRQNNQSAALVFVDIDNFRAVNESLGHGAGDRYLCEALVRLQRFVPNEALVCRYGGDKFAVLLSELPEWDTDTLQAHLRQVAANILRGLAEPFELDKDLLPMSVSIGISVFPADGDTSEQLVSSAEAAMYLAKRQGRNNVQFANPTLMGDARRQLTTTTELRRGLENREFEPFYQPVVNVATGEVVGAEALLRWRHPQRGVVVAGEFIPAAEACGLIDALGELCMIKACEQAGVWNQSSEFRISVNLSARQIENRSAVTLLNKLHANGSGRGAKGLDFEITETAILQHLDQVQRTLKDIQAMGHKLSVDDFGTGYSSLVYLQRFPVNRIKIDRSFVSRMNSSREAQAIVSATIALARSLDLEVVAEGVETEDQMSRLQALGCVLQQGFFFTPALAATEFEAWRRARTGAHA